MKELLKNISEPVSQAANNLANPLTKSIGQTLSDLWEISIGSHLSLARNKQNYRQERKYEQYKETINSKLQKIPQENLVEPPLHIVGPALEASRFYIEADELKEMFANLIASSMDSRRISQVHPSFTEVIKQLSPLDAANIELFKEGNDYPICDYRASYEGAKGFSTLATNVFLENPDVQDLALQATSISNLIRLGLIESPNSAYMIRSDAYEKFEKTKAYKEFVIDISKHIENGDIDKDGHITIHKRLVRLTPMGVDFLQAVFRDDQVKI
ncbi:hypothetical protein DJ86_662 [Bacillus cereus ATCC 4342]|uniref:DUF4393 domain-containing protein n=1 Tax=Bacillus tropicus TaxID=2026188 RepID=UPI0001A01612|nr:DUF4393 domain-containing protein [Bacillus tropicus]AJH72241.1 hypothetical protein BF35_3916 [Bacillus cereus ATCC 4342]EEK82552.1 hypothetical protein bcere0010_40240 [Bacillus cereus ATCC 4342]KFM86672.1 hypothetical protein DJ86_662 [Bacillus cereus ATCC 4342]MDR4455203.1 DUF4393 domain-containing protein [Bacillus tropicus]QKH55995.1 DUF4393 domain-containing protein [Bacillus tropicus]